MIDLSDPHLTNQEREVLQELLNRAPHTPPTLEDMWQLMDEVWDELGCDNKNPNAPNVSAFYSHPVWTLNGLFVEQHPTSLTHRTAIVDWITNLTSSITKVADFGGGFGTLARMLGKAIPTLHVDIVDPFPSALAVARAKPIANVVYVDQLSSDYDCVVCTDVLEHVPDPLALLATMRQATRPGGYLLIANHFSPSIKCHLPATFHLRLSFSFLARLMGMPSLGPCQGSHALVFKKEKDAPINWPLIRFAERISRLSGPLLRVAFWAKKTWKTYRS